MIAAIGRWYAPSNCPKIQNVKCGEMQRNVEKYRELQRNVEKCREMQRNLEKCREIQENVEKCKKVQRNKEKWREMQRNAKKCKEMQRNPEKLLLLLFVTNSFYQKLRFFRLNFWGPKLRSPNFFLTNMMSGWRFAKICQISSPGDGDGPSTKSFFHIPKLFPHLSKSFSHLPK